MKNRVSVMILIIFLTLMSTVVILARSSHVVATISTDKTNYNLDETVTISSFSFVSNTKVNVEVIGPDGILNSWIVNANREGDFVTTYHLDGTAGMYTIKVCDGTNGVELTFTVTAQTIEPKDMLSATITTDKSEYKFGEVTTIKGCGFQPNVKVNVEVIRPDGTFDNWLTESGTEGLFFTTYGLDETTGIYTVKACDGVCGTEISFIVKAPDVDEQLITQPEDITDFKQP